MLWASVASAQTVGKVQTYAGDVRLARASKAVPVSVGMDVLRGDHFTTGVNGRLVILLNDQSSLDVYDSSDLVVNDQVLSSAGAASTRLSLFAGVMRSLVHVAGGTTPSFEVHTPNAIAAARGTDFDTGYHTNQHRANYQGCTSFTDVYTRQGNVEVSSLGTPGKNVTVGPNQSTTVPCGGAPIPVAPGMGAVALYATGIAAALEGGIVGGYAGAGGFSGGSSPPPVSNHR